MKILLAVMQRRIATVSFHYLVNVLALSEVDGGRCQRAYFDAPGYSDCCCFRPTAYLYGEILTITGV